VRPGAAAGWRSRANPLRRRDPNEISAIARCCWRPLMTYSAMDCPAHLRTPRTRRTRYAARLS
jgi:hypothetical protein